MQNQLVITSVAIGPPRETDPPELLCYAAVTFCGCFTVSGCRLVTSQTTGRAGIFFPYMLRISADGRVMRREHSHPNDRLTRSMIEWAVVRAYRTWRDTLAAEGRCDECLEVACA